MRKVRWVVPNNPDEHGVNLSTQRSCLRHPCIATIRLLTGRLKRLPGKTSRVSEYVIFERGCK